MYNQLPSQGLLCLAYPAPTQGYIQRFYSTVDELQQWAEYLDKLGHNVFIAQASFKEAGSRKGINAQAVRSFWLDIDCGQAKFEKDPHKNYPDQLAGAAALKDFCAESGIPMPCVVNSGNGLYAHWLLTEDISPEQWKATANLFKDVLLAYGFKTDPVRTADIASILRPVGVHNHKDKENPKPVALVTMQPALSYAQFVELVERAAKAKKVSSKQLAAPKGQDLNAEFLIGLEDGPPCYAEVIAGKCNQLRMMRDTKGDIPEPLWYDVIGVMRHCVEGEALIHEWSVGHEDYTPDKTTLKINQHKMPPTTCMHFGQINPTGCIGCSHKDKIRSPITLGRLIEAVDVTTVDEDRLPLPAGFELTEDGIFWVEDAIRVYHLDIYPTRVNFDVTLGYETVTFKHYMQKDGWQEFTVRSSLMHDQRSAFQLLHDNSVQIDGATEKKLMTAYVSAYINMLRDRNGKGALQCQMGWQGEEGSRVFVLGDKMYRKGETPANIGLAKNIPEAVKGYRQVGDLQKWVHHTHLFNLPGAEGHAFGFMSGAFGAPLMAFTGFEGALVSCVGESGIGKSLIATVLQSVYGDPRKLIMLKDDTKNSIVSRLGVYGSLPLTIDEVSNIDPLELSDLVYRVTQGRDKARLTRNATEKAFNNSWNTLAVVSSNHSLVDKLGALKADAGAEINRVFEYTMHAVSGLTQEVCTDQIHRVVTSNYGLVGPVYVQYLVDKQDDHQANIDKLMKHIQASTNAKAEERYWVAITAVTIYGGLLAQKLGLILFDPMKVLAWAIEQFKHMRHTKSDQQTDSIAILGQFLDKFAANALIVSKNNADTSNAWKTTNGAIIYRVDMDTMKCYISRDVLRRELNKMYGSYSKLKYDLQNTQPSPALMRTDLRKVLTSGIHGFAGAQQYVWEIDLSNPQLGMVKAQIVQKQEEITGKVVGRIG